MKKILKNFKEWVEGPDGDGPLGNYVFPDEKRDKYRTPESDAEKYTSLEKQLERLLDSHFSSSKHPLPRRAADKILDMIKDYDYPGVFQLQDAGKAYRGMSLPTEVFQKLFGEMPNKAKWYSAPVDWWYDRARKSGVSFPFSPEKKPGYSPGMDTHAGSWSSSWSWEMQPAKEFAQEIAHEEGNISIVLVADASKNTFINAKPLYAKFDFAHGYRKEKELIGVGDIELTDIYILYSPEKLKEAKEPLPLPDLKNIALFHDEEVDNHELILYTMGSNGPFPFAACGVDRLSENKKGSECIPETWQMSWIYVNKNLRGSGWSKILYGIGFNLVNKIGAGLTSDHWAGTSDTAQDRVWNKLMSRGQVVARKTPGSPPVGGHSEFDYGDPGFKKTPLDPLDDCDKPTDEMATDSSWVLKGHTKFEPVYQSLIQNHKDLMSSAPDRQQFESDLSNKAAVEFETAYRGEDEI